MDTQTSAAIVNSVNAVSTAATVSVVAYLIVAVWWAGAVEARSQEALERHATCYREWSFNEAHKERWLRVDYCGQTETHE